MRITIRSRLAAIVASTALAFVMLIIASTFATAKLHDRLVQIEEQQIPKLAIGPQLVADFAELRRTYQDAVAAHDIEALGRTRDVKTRIVAALERGHDALDPTASAAFRAALEDYAEIAFDVSRRMIAGEGGESLIETVRLMQNRQARAEALLGQVANFDQRSLAATFRSARDLQASSARTRLMATLGCFATVFALALWLSRGLGRSLATLEEGFARFAKGKFDEAIQVEGQDEIADAAAEANRMAESLARLATEREHTDWIKSGLMDLARELRGDLDEQALATGATRILVRHLDAAAAALYTVRREERPVLRLAGHYAGDASPSFEIGQGLVGEAARSTEVVVVGTPADFRRVRSGLGESSIRFVALVPLLRDGEVTGVLEVGFFDEPPPPARELLLRARETIAISLVVAEGRAATRELLEKTQEQARRLQHQEEELRSTNEELRFQQDELQLTNRELESRANELAQQRLALQEKARELATVSAYKSQFLANMSHELRTPLNSMLLLSQMLSDNSEGNLTHKQVEHAKTVHAAGRDLLHLINQVLDLAKVEAGKQDIHLGETRIGDVVERVRRVFSPLAEEKGLQLVIDVAPDAPETLTTDALRLNQILTNLVGNAIKFTSRGAVTLRVRQPGERFVFSVTDTGIGIAPEDRKRIFAPFEQVDSSARRKHGGTGLGLSISRQFATLLGGELTVESVPGQGSTFHCSLPFRNTDERTPSSLPAPRPTEPGSHVDILVIEDDHVFSEVIGQIIRERGHSCFIAPDAGTGIRVARENQPRGIILDVKLPDVNGWSVMDQLRSDPTTASIPVHFISAVAMPERGLAMGAAGYLTKPVDRQDLVRVVEALAPSAAQTSHRILVLEGDSLGGSLTQQLADGGLQAIRARSTAEATSLLERESFACMILDLTIADTHGLTFLQSLADRAGKEMPAVVVYTNRQLSRDEVARLETYAEAVVLKDENASSTRLQDEIRLFLRRLEAGLPRRMLAAPLTGDVPLHLEGKKILIADDDMRTAYALSAMLRTKGAEVLVADTGAAAIALITENPDVTAVLMDVMMPELDGYEATRRIREQARFHGLPIIMLTAKAMKGDEARAIDAGASAYLAKPVDSDSLLALLDVQLSRAEEARA